MNMTTLVVAGLAIVAVVFLVRKRYDSNLPLFFYLVAVAFTNLTGAGINPYLLYTGLIFALLLRFEFMNKAFTNVIAFFATGSMCLIVLAFLADVFGEQIFPF